jgi:hypothetical protein
MGHFFAWKVWRNTGILIIFAEEIATGGGEGNCHILLAFSQDIYKGLNTHLHTVSEVCGVLLLSALFGRGKGRAGSVGKHNTITQLTPYSG